MPCASFPASFLFTRLSGSAPTEPALSCLRFFSFRPFFPRFPHVVYNVCAVSCASSPPPTLPDPLPSLLLCVCPRVSTPAPVPVSILHFSARLHPRSHSHSVPVPITVVCACLLIAHTRAIRPCHRSHYMPLELILPRADQLCFSRKPLIKRDKGDTLSLLVQFLLKP